MDLRNRVLAAIAQGTSGRYGRAPKGRRLRAAVPRGHWKITTLVARLRFAEIVAPFVIDMPINRVAFETYINKVLVSELKAGDIVVMDNFSSHKGPALAHLIEAAGARLLDLSPYSPDFNPIEMAFSKLKALLRKAEERTIEAFWTTIGKLVDSFEPGECVNFFKAAGYDADRSDSALARASGRLDGAV